jgi:hypothetical protein
MCKGRYHTHNMRKFINPVTAVVFMRVLFKIWGLYISMSRTLYIADILSGWVLLWMTEPPPIMDMVPFLITPFVTGFYFDFLTLIMLGNCWPDTHRKHLIESYKWEAEHSKHDAGYCRKWANHLNQGGSVWAPPNYP